MKAKWKLLILCIAIPLIMGELAGFISRKCIIQFSILNKPPLSPPGWLFLIVWTILYILMGFASYFILISNANPNILKKSLKAYGAQLVFNFSWAILFFNFELYFFSFLWLIVLWVLIAITIVLFYKILPLSAYLMIPYILWISFAGYLNFVIILLN